MSDISPLPPGLANLQEYLFTARKMYDRVSTNNHVRAYFNSYELTALDAVLSCVARVLEGKLTQEELQNLCHNLGPEDEAAFKEGCTRLQEQLFGKDCPFCHGSGWMYDPLNDRRHVDCAQCGGGGKIQPHPSAPTSGRPMKECPNCQGKGELATPNGYFLCAACKGKGEVRS